MPELPPTADDGSAPTNASPPLPRLAVTVAQFNELTTIKRTTTYKLIRAGRLDVIHVGRRTLILMSSVDRLLASVQVEVQP